MKQVQNFKNILIRVLFKNLSGTCSPLIIGEYAPKLLNIRTNWIITIEKLVSALNLTDKIENKSKFKNAANKALEDGYREYWTKSLRDPASSRLDFYKTIKTELRRETFLDVLNFEQRRTLTKLRCSDHTLEIEKGRHKGIKDRTKRICPTCPYHTIENEEHFIYKCNSYNHLRLKYNVGRETIKDLFSENLCTNFANYVIECFKYRDEIQPGRGDNV